jgi:CRISPR-associated endonuclease/helicase Cas3
MGFAEFFETLTSRRPYPYQERLAAILHAGSSVVLRAPTGAGKTWAAIAPFLFER